MWCYITRSDTTHAHDPFRSSSRPIRFSQLFFAHPLRWKILPIRARAVDVHHDRQRFGRGCRRRQALPAAQHANISRCSRVACADLRHFHKYYAHRGAYHRRLEGSRVHCPSPPRNRYVPVVPYCIHEQCIYVRLQVDSPPSCPTAYPEPSPRQEYCTFSTLGSSRVTPDFF
jgi:hypothetical protein